MSDQGTPPKLPSRPPPTPRDSTGEAVATVIPYRNPMALAAYYMGIFSIIPLLGIFLGAAAFVCGILGIRHASKHEGAHGRAHAAIGIGCGGLFFLANMAALIAMLGVAMSVQLD